MRLREITNANLVSLGIFHPTLTEKQLNELVDKVRYLTNDIRVLLTGSQDVNINRSVMPEIDNAIIEIDDVLRVQWDDLTDPDIINIVKSLTQSKQAIEQVKHQLKI